MALCCDRYQGGENTRLFRVREIKIMLSEARRAQKTHPLDAFSNRVVDFLG